jgi:hypothetical protein
MTSRSEETSNKYFPEEFLFDLGEFEKSLVFKSFAKDHDILWTR